MQEDHYEGALLENIYSQNKAILEAVGMMQDNVKKIPHIEEMIEKLSVDMDAVKLVSKSNSKDVQAIKAHTKKLDDQAKNYGVRITSLEAVL